MSTSPQPQPTDVAPTRAPQVEDIDLREGQLGGTAKLEVQLRDLGMRLAQWLLIGIGLSLVAILVFAWATYPSVKDAASLAQPASGMAAPSGAAARSAQSAAAQVATLQPLEIYRELRNDWFASVKDLAQLLLLSLFVPLLATVVGHIFTRQSS